MKKWAEKFYKGKAWRRARLAYLIKKNYVCERCGLHATLVHHRIYLNESNINEPSIALDEKNFEALCDRCHQHEHHKSTAVSDGYFFDENGDLKEKPGSPLFFEKGLICYDRMPHLRTIKRGNIGFLERDKAFLHNYKKTSRRKRKRWGKMKNNT